jgi:hypothetical protein
MPGRVRPDSVSVAGGERAPDLGIDNGATLITTALRQGTFRPRP